MQHAFIQIWRIRNRTHTINDHTRLNCIRHLTSGGRTHGITPRRPWHNHHPIVPVVPVVLTLTTIIPLSVFPIVGGGSRREKMFEKYSRGDMELKLFLAPFDWARGNACNDQTLMWVGVERWG
jgi:hypothetical protein